MLDASPPSTPSKTDNNTINPPISNGLVSGLERDRTTSTTTEGIPLLDPTQPPVELDPWRDDSDTATNDVTHKSLKTPDPSVFYNDPSVSGLTPPLDGLTLRTIALRDAETKPEEAERPHVPDGVLQDFDPLTSQDEKAARDAWQSAESHPPPPSTGKGLPRTPSPSASKESPISSHSPSPSLISTSLPIAAPTAIATSSSSTTNTFTPPGFPSLAALARTFALPSLGSSKQRPQSIDIAKPVPSPAALSSFAVTQHEQQESRPASRTGLIPTSTPDAANQRSTTPVAEVRAQPPPSREVGSGVASPMQRSDGGGRARPAEMFDFQKFLDQMKSKSAEPVAKYLRSFLSNFSKRTYAVNDQIKLINDFLAFISNHMRSCEVWKNASDPEFDNAMEGMEKLVMNRLYEFTFTPEIARSVPPRPITTDDLERDRVLAQRIALFGWLEENHLDIPEGDGSKGFMMFAQQELIKINHYKAPRDKLICILNCCKVIFGLIRHMKREEGADAFIPILIFIVLKANPENLLSNVEFISRFRNPEKLQSEAGYYLSSLMGAVSFIETMDHTSLSNITQEEFEQNVEDAIHSLPDSSPNLPYSTPSFKTLPRTLHSRASGSSAHLLPPSATTLSTTTSTTPTTPSISIPPSPRAGEEPATPLSLPALSQGQSLSDDAKRLLQKTGDTISKPLNAIGRIFSEALDGAESKLTYLPGPFAPFELARERERESGEGDEQYHHLQQQQHWAHPDQIKQHAYLQEGGSAGGSRSGSPAPYMYVDRAGRPYTPPPQIPMPYKPRVKRVPLPYLDTPTPAPRGSGSASGGQGPYTHQALAMDPSQSVYGSPSPQHPHTQHLTHQYQQQRDDGQNSPRGDSPPWERSSPSSSPHPSLPSLQHHFHQHSNSLSRTPTPALPDLDIAGLQAQIDDAYARTAAKNKETLWQMFPGVDQEVVDWVLEAHDNDLGRSIEALLELSSGE